MMDETIDSSSSSSASSSSLKKYHQQYHCRHGRPPILLKSSPGSSSYHQLHQLQEKPSTRRFPKRFYHHHQRQYCFNSKKLLPSSSSSSSLVSIYNKLLIIGLIIIPILNNVFIWSSSNHQFMVEANSIVGLSVEHFPNHQHQQQHHHNNNPTSSLDDPKSNEVHGTAIQPISIKPDLFGLITEVNVECNSNVIQISLKAPHLFNGMIYPKGLSKNSTCMFEYFDVINFNYTLPLRACNTMFMDVDDGVEYFNTVIVQPHRKLVTNQGRGYHIRCRYQTKDKRITNGYNLTLSNLGQDGKTETTPLFGQAPVPTSSMKIYHQGTQKEIIADNVKIGDRLTLTINIEQQDIYGMKITNCLVRDGLNWGEQPLINDEGCPVDKEIMGPFEYFNNLTKASVSFHAHKFPYTSSVYYQCNVRLCLKDDDGCDDVPPSCDQNGRNYRHHPSTSSNSQRKRRDTYDAVVIAADPSSNQFRSMAQRMRNHKLDKDLSMEVYSGLYVDESNDNQPETDLDDSDDYNPSDIDDVKNLKRKRGRLQNDPNEFCISMRKFAIGVAIASLLLMLAVLLLVICILQRRRRRHSHQHQRLYSSTPTTPGGSTIGGGSIYSGQYTNRAYSRD